MNGIQEVSGSIPLISTMRGTSQKSVSTRKRIFVSAPGTASDPHENEIDSLKRILYNKDKYISPAAGQTISLSFIVL